MSIRRLLPFLIVTALLLAGCAEATPTAIIVPTTTNVPTALPPTTAPTPVPAPASSLPYAHTACAAGVNLTGQTINLYHLLDPGSQVDTWVTPAEAGYADASAYFNAHGGICGATIGQVFPDPGKQFDAQAEYTRLAALTPKPVLITLTGTGIAESLRDQLSKDQIPALGFVVGTSLALYGENGQTLGWIFSTNPLYSDQIGAFCNYVAAHPDRFPHPVLGFINWDDSTGQDIYIGAGRAHCAPLGVGYAGSLTTNGDDSSTQPAVQKLISAGATIIYTFANENVPASIAKILVQAGVQTTVTLAAYNWAFDPAVAGVGEQDLGPDGLPMINGMIGSLAMLSLAELDNPGITLITQQADANNRWFNLRAAAYIKAWSTTDLFREVYVQTGNRVGFDHITGADIKTTLEKIVYSPLAGVERIDFQGGARRALSADRIGQMGFLGADGKTPAGPGNLPKNVSANSNSKLFAPLLVPLTDYARAPDLRTGGADLPAAATPSVPAATPTKKP